MLNILPILLAFNSILPPINNVYKSTISIPILGRQSVEYQRTQKYESEIRLSGILDCVGSISYNEKDVYDYKLDKQLTKMLKRYRCQILEPKYDNDEDVLCMILKLNIINFKRRLVMKNIEDIEY